MVSDRTVVDILFCFQAEDGIRDLVRSRGLGDVYKRQVLATAGIAIGHAAQAQARDLQAAAAETRVVHEWAPAGGDAAMLSAARLTCADRASAWLGRG